MVLLALALLLVAGPAAAGPLDSPGALKALNCSACHGQGGQSPGETVPILAGIRPDYFKKAIADYAAGRRPSPEMEPYAKQVLEFGVDDYAAYFAAQPRKPPAGRVDRAAVERGRAASAACAACHGPEGKGDPARGAPDITGQPAAYLLNQLRLFKQDRRSPGDAALRAAKETLKAIPDETLADLAAYYSSLR
jgi:cytochrome c553